MDVRVLYLDIDGTVRKTQWGMNRAGQVQVFPEAIRLMALWKARGGRIAGVSNQGGIALGIVSQSQVLAAMRETQERTGNLFDAIFFASTILVLRALTGRVVIAASPFRVRSRRLDRCWRSSSQVKITLLLSA